MRQRISRTLTLATLVVFPILSGCGPSEPDPAAAVAQAGKQLDLGNTQGAIDILQAYEERKPGNPQIIEQLAFAWSQKGDLKTAAYYFNRLAELRPDQPDAMLFAAQSLQQAGDAEGAMVTYQQYLAKKPEDVGASMTFAAIAAANGRTDAAIGQYTYVYGLKPSAEAALSLGNLYLKKADMQQAALWFEKAKADKPQEYSLGMLEVAMRGQNYPQAETLIAQIKKDFPGALEVSSMKDAPDTIDRWREKQADGKKAVTDAAAAAKKRQEEAAKPKIEVKSADTTVVLPVEPVAVISVPVQAEPHRLTKAEAVALEEAREDQEESLAVNQLSQAPEEIPAEAAEIMAKPAVPAQPVTQVQPVAAAKPVEVARPVAIVPAAVASPAAPVISDVLEDARNAVKVGRQDDAARLYQSFLARTPSALAWNEFSLLSMDMGRPGQAMAASLEATRLDPYNLDYAVQYLSVVEKLYDERRVMSELMTMKRRFPESPVIALALARAYWEVERNAGMSRYYYNEYLDKSPKNETYDEIKRERDTVPLP